MCHPPEQVNKNGAVGLWAVDGLGNFEDEINARIRRERIGEIETAGEIKGVGVDGLPLAGGQRHVRGGENVIGLAGMPIGTAEGQAAGHKGRGAEGGRHHELAEGVGHGLVIGIAGINGGNDVGAERQGAVGDAGGHASGERFGIKGEGVGEKLNGAGGVGGQGGGEIDVVADARGIGRTGEGDIVDGLGGDDGTADAVQRVVDGGVAAEGQAVGGDDGVGAHVGVPTSTLPIVTVTSS